ncbi:MAG: hypothetical protein R2770_09710 [Acidimicrobiales bacterium]|nr:hypothetical protein [Acidimicrobiales bacterium]
MNNSIDQFLIDRATSVSVRFAGDMVEVLDDGPGLPFDQMSESGGRNLVESFCTTLRDARSVDDHAPHIHLSSLGAGLAPVAALAAELDIVSVRGSVCWQQMFNCGVPGPLTVLDPGPIEHGTRVRYTIDREIFEPGVSFDRRTIRTRLFEAAHLFPGLRVGVDSEAFYSSSGLADLAPLLLPPRFAPATTSANGRHEDVQLDFVAVDGPASQRFVGEGTVLSWVNGSAMVEHGHHVSGIRDVLAEREWWPSLVLAHVVMHSPEFAGPTRGRLNAPHVREAVAQILRDHLPQREQ